jgi:hypothetical protein
MIRTLGMCTSVLLLLLAPAPLRAQTVAAWPFDEPVGIYPSCVISDVSESDYPMVIGPGARIVPGKFGNALELVEQPKVDYPVLDAVHFGLAEPPREAGQRGLPLTWHNANFAALMTAGDNHLRKEVGFVNPTESRLNLGAFDWTVEFWFQATRVSVGHGVVFELGRAPRGESDETTALLLEGGNAGFTLINRPAGIRLRIPSDRTALQPETDWHHFAFTYSASEGRLRHYVDGRLQKLPAKVSLRELPACPEAYFSVGRDGAWSHPLPGKIDELRFSDRVIYREPFIPPGSFSPLFQADSCQVRLQAGPPLLFARGSKTETPIRVGGRKHLFIDDALIDEMSDVSFTVNPARLEECVLDDIQGPFRKHLNVVEDEEGNIRLYHGIQGDFLGVHVSRDGIRFEAPALRDAGSGLPRNTVLPEKTAMGMVFLDPNAEPGQRWKYLSDYHRRGIYLYSSPDGYSFARHPLAVLPFRSGSQSNIFYDDQRQLYVSYHRTDFPATPSGKTQREFVLTETRDLVKPWPFRPQTQAEIAEIANTKRLRDLSPWYLDNGPLTPGGFGVEYPIAFGPDPELDPAGTDIYVPKALKYPWAPDTYLAFPLLYFHYDSEGPRARRTLGDEARGLGSGPVETQLAVSRDGIHWKRYPRPAYVGIGRHGADPIHQAYMAQGMVRRGNEIWQYYFGEEAYHSSWKRNTKRAVYRVSQRLDGFVSVDAPYDREAYITTKPLVFEGNRLVLNIDTDAAGYAQVGFLDESGRPLPGFALEECVYINGDFIEGEVEWLSKGKDLSSLEGRAVRLLFRLRGAKLYAMQFKKAD